MDLDNIKELIMGFVLVSLIAASGAIALSGLQSDVKTDKTSTRINESVTLTPFTDDVVNETITFENTTSLIENETVTMNAANTSANFANTDLTVLISLTNASITSDNLLGYCNVTLSAGLLTCNATESLTIYANYTYVSNLTANLLNKDLTAFTAIRNTSSQDIRNECDITLVTGALRCNNTHSNGIAFADYTYNSYSTGVVSQASLYVSTSACRNSTMSSILLNADCNVTNGVIRGNYHNFTDNLAFIDYTYYTPSHIINITNDGLMGIDNTTSYFGTAGTIAGVALLLTIVLGAFYFVTRRIEP